MTQEATIEGLITQHNDGLELMLLDSLKKSIFLSFTLSDGKVYIGVVNSHFFSPYQNESFQIWPFYSGYRKEDKSMELNTDYSEVYNNYLNSGETAKLDQFSVTIRVSEILACSYFDRDVYEEFSLEEE